MYALCALSPLLPAFILRSALVNDNIAEYLATKSSPLENRLVLKKIVESVFQHGSFLTRGSAGSWAPISKEEALLKTATALEYRARKLSNPEQSLGGNVNMSHILTPHSKSSQVRSQDIFHPPVPRVIHVPPPFHLVGPAVVVPRSIRMYSNCSFSGSITTTEAQERCNLSYQYLRQCRELCNQANDHYLISRFTASNAHSRGPAGFPESNLHHHGALYNADDMNSDWVKWSGGTCTAAQFRETASAPPTSSTSASFWEPLALLDAHSETGRCVLSELPVYFTPICNESLDPSQPLDGDW
jgi:hypothetical protein